MSNTNMLPWDSFLEKAADNHKLFVGDDRQIFLKRFSEEHLNNSDAKVAAKLNISEVALQRGLGNVYKAFSQSCPPLESNKKGKFKVLLHWLKSEYANSEKTSKESEIKWRDICLAMLEAEKQQRLTTNELMGDEDDRFELEEIHVPLALVERKKPDRRGGETQAEQGSRQYEPEYEEKQRFEHEQFLLDILKDGKGKHKGKRIAIIGEPGAGKTTLLRKIAFWVQKNTEILPISISLADLLETNAKQEFLEQYLLDKWLKAALPYISPEIVEVTEALKIELKKLCNQGRVWLLLDGVDEMPVQGEERLGAISNQLKGWVGQARVVLTCRLNVWEANRNVLADNFEIYRTLDFSYGDSTTPDRVEEFIAKWFNKTPNLGQQLRQALEEPGKERIKDLAKNPLRLALLCSTWNRWRDRGGLPDTKVKLYQGFVEKFYDWKGKEFTTNSAQRKKLNRALGELAKLAIDQNESRFRLKHSLVCKVLGQPDEELFGLALKLGWLNKVGLAAESPDETVYAFWHPTFEEYFAALAIDDRDFFLNHVPHNPKQGIYRIFEKQWKEVILLWLGRENVETEKKEEFIKTLVEFNDGCNGFYWYQAYFSAAVGIAEFKDCSIANEIVEQIVKLGFGYFNEEKQEWINFIDPMAEGAREALLNTQITKAIAALADWVQNSQNEYTRWIAALSFEKIGKDNPIAINALVYLLDNSQNGQTQYAAAKSLEVIGKDNPIAIALLEELLQKCQNEDTSGIAARSLGVIEKDNQLAIATLVQIIKNPQDEFSRLGAVWALQTIDENHPTVIPALVDLSQNCQDKFTRFNAAQSLLKINKNNPTATVSLVDLIYNNQDEIGIFATSMLEKIDEYNPIINAALVNLKQNYQFETTSKPVAFSLEEIEKANITVNAALVNFIQECQNEDNCYKAVSRLKDILTVAQMPEVVNTLNKYLVDNTYSNDSKRNVYCYQVIGHCAQHMSYPEFYQSWNIKTIDSYHKYLQIQRLLNNRQSEAYCLFTIGTLYKKNGKFWEGLAYIQQAMEILEEIDLPLDDYPIHSWVKWVIKFDQNAILKIGVPIMLVLIIFSVWQFLLD